MDVIKDHLIKDGNLIVHMGPEEIPQTRFFVLNRQNAVEVKKLIEDFLEKQDGSES